MSVKALSKFSNAVAIDPSLKEKIEREVNISLEKLTSMDLATIEAANSDYLATMTKIAHEYGYYFTEDELKAQIDRYSSDDCELDDDSLDAAVGGISSPYFPNPSDRSHNFYGWLRL